MCMQIDDHIASLVIAQLLFLQSESSKKPIHMYINRCGMALTTRGYGLDNYGPYEIIGAMGWISNMRI